MPVTYYQYTGGAHGLTTKVSYNYNLKTGNELKLKDLFKEGFDYKSIIDKKVKEDIEKKRRSFILIMELCLRELMKIKLTI